MNLKFRIRRTALRGCCARSKAGWRPKYLCFWGHQAYPGERAGKHVLSQWWESAFEIGGVRYLTAEHYMMAEKARLFGDDALLPEILAAPSPAAAKALGRRVKNFAQPEWDAHRFGIVVRGSVAKFGQNADLRTYLLNTGEQVLVEASPVDPVWGVSLAEGDPRLERPEQWRGLNLLGFALMKARAILRAKPAHPDVWPARQLRLAPRLTSAEIMGSLQSHATEPGGKPRMSFFRTMLLLSALTALFMSIGFAIGGGPGMTIAFMIAAATNLFAYWNSDRMVLSQQGAEEVDESQEPGLYAIVRQLAANAGLPMPRVYIIQTDQPNAFATGRNPENAAIAASSGLLRMMTRDEIAGVLGHELAHVKNRDTLTMTIAATIAGAISMLAQFGMFFGGNRREGGGRIAGTLLAIIVAPIAAALIQMALSRSREYAADHDGALISGHPLWLASALKKIEGAAREIRNEQAQDYPATASLYIINPLSGGGMDNLFSTHPDTENRIAALEQQAQEMGQVQQPGDDRMEARPVESPASRASLDRAGRPPEDDAGGAWALGMMPPM